MYIRFKNIPPDEISGVYDGDCGKVRDEVGVSCYKTYTDDGIIYKIELPSLSEATLYDLLDFTRDHLRGEIPVYLIDGDYVGIGSTGEPCVKNTHIIKELKIEEQAHPKPKFKMDRSYPHFVVK